mmetsp:Transcript_120689/g.352489  ORF Transcript_120689/g.352489 Transcript_120689/m.352489 type:complete len:136 (+) Transcript_120689:744-1151(+)
MTVKEDSCLEATNQAPDLRRGLLARGLCTRSSTTNNLCFTSADAGHSDQITAADFDGLVDAGAAAPRKFGFAPQASDMFTLAEERTVARAKVFRTIDEDGSGDISFQEFLAWAVDHIRSKVMRDATPWKAGVSSL